MLQETDIGKPSAWVVQEIARLNPDVQTMKFARYFPLDRDEIDLFWHVTQDEVVNGSVLADLLSPRYRMPLSQIGFISLAEIADPRDIYHLKHYFVHFPILLLTSDAPNPEQRVGMIQEVLRGPLKQPSGWIMSAHQDYYYFCGDQAMGQAQWSDFMTVIRGRQINGVSMPDNYMDLALRPKITRETGGGHPYATLRISTNNHLPAEPKVVAVL